MKLLRQLMEMEFKNYEPSMDEIEDEIEQIKRSLKMAKEQGKAPMVAKYDLQLRQALKKRTLAKKNSAGSADDELA